MSPSRPAPLVLLAEDDWGLRDLLAEVLRAEGYRVLAARDGAHALAQLDGEPPAVVVTDLQMPRLDGIGLIAALRERGVAAPAVLLSTQDRLTKVDADRAAVVPLAKPFDLDDLLAAVASLLNRMSGRRAPQCRSDLFAGSELIEESAANASATAKSARASEEAQLSASPHLGFIGTQQSGED